MVGETLGNYRLIQQIGEGGMGAVYLAEHVHLQRKAAVKLLLPEHSQKQELVQRFFNEAKLAASLNHPGIVEILDFGFDARGAAYLVMGYIEGESLSKRVERNGPLPLGEAVELARQIALVVDAAHQKGIVHRDLKTDNIMQTAPVGAPAPGGFAIKVLDFGIAKLLGSNPLAGNSKATSTGMILGTPLFMAPEQCRGVGQIDHRADIYSLGCILFVLLTGRPPFPYEGIGELLAAHLGQEPPAPSTVRPDVPPWLDHIVLSTLQKDPDARPQTMGALAAALDAGRALPQATGPSPRSTKTSVLSPGSTGAGTFARGTTTFRDAAQEQDAEVEERPRRNSALPVILGIVVALGGVGAAAAFALRSKPKPPETGDSAGANGGETSHTTGSHTGAAGAGAANPIGTQVGQPIKADAAPPDTASETTTTTTAAKDPEPDESPPADEPPAGKGKVAPHGGKGPKAHVGKPTAEPEVDAEAKALFERGMAAVNQRRDVDALLAFRAFQARTSGNSWQRQEATRQLIRLRASMGELSLQCDVPGAQVTLNKMFIGRTPLPVQFLRPGPHAISVVAGNRHWEKRFDIAPGQRLEFRVQVAP